MSKIIKSFVPLCIILIIIRINKEYLLQIPSVGYILFGIAGGSIPGYVNDEAFRNEKLWASDFDVIISSPVKSGSTWMMHTLHEIRARQNPPNYQDIYLEVPWLDFVAYPGQPFEERTELFKNSRKKYRYSCFKTHLYPPLINLRNNAKYIVVFRSLVDALASLRTFFAKMDPKFAEIWGGFPPLAGKNMTDEEYGHFVLDEMGGGVGALDYWFINHIQGWLPHVKKPNVLLVHFSDRIKNHNAMLTKIAKFVGVNLKQEELDRISYRTSFDWMKANQEQFDMLHILDSAKDRGLIPKNVTFLPPETMIGQGPTRKGTWDLAGPLRIRIKDRMFGAFGNDIVKWLTYGGEFPEFEFE